MSAGFVLQSKAGFPPQFNPGTPTNPQGRYRPPYQPSPPPGMMQSNVPGGWPGSQASHVASHAASHAANQASRPQMPQQRMVTFMPHDLRMPKPPKAPEKPLVPYLRYSRKVWEQVKGQNPDLKLWEMSKMIGEMWKELPELDKKDYVDEYEVERSEYKELFKEFQNSTAYQQWLQSKGRTQAAMQEQQMMEKMIGGPIPRDEPRFQLQQIDEEDDEEAFSIKHVASARFYRNHRLISEIFNDQAVPDIKTIVTRPRLENLKKQVQSLMQHQRKLEQEIAETQERHESRKRKILESNEKFRDSLKKFCEAPKINATSTGDSTTDDVFDEDSRDSSISQGNEENKTSSTVPQPMDQSEPQNTKQS